MYSTIMRFLRGGARTLSPKQRQEQSERAFKTIQRTKPWNRGRIGKVEAEIEYALSAAHGVPVSTRDLVHWVYHDARWDMSIRRNFPDDYPLEHVHVPKYPPLAVKDKKGTVVVPTPAQIGQILQSVKAFGRCVGYSRGGGGKLWMLREAPDGSPLHFYDVRKEKTERRRKALQRKIRRYGKE
jgi:hypothetical protein